MLGAIDGKHIRIESPKTSGTLYHSYNGFVSLNLVALFNADYRFSMFDVGEYGSNNDGGVFANSNVSKRFKSGTFNLPERKPLHRSKFSPLPYNLLSNEISPLKP